MINMQPLTVNFKPSTVLASTLILAGLFAIGMVLIVPLAMVIKAVLVAWIIISVVLAVRRYAYLQHAKAVLSLKVNSLNVLHVRFKNNQKLDCTVLHTILPSSMVTSYLLILQLKGAGNLRFFNWLPFLKTQSLVILPDSIAGDSPTETMRQLRVWLRMASQHKAHQSEEN